MRLETRNPEGVIPQEVRDHLERRMRFVLGRFGSRVGRVTVHLADGSGPGGGTAPHCRIAVRLVPAGRILVEDSDPVPEAMVERVTDRVGQAVRRELERQRAGRGGWPRGAPAGDLAAG